MTYYSIEWVDDRNIIGCAAPQIEEARPDYIIHNNPLAFPKLKHYEFFNGQPDLEKFPLKYGAKLTDRISALPIGTGIGLFINDRLKEFLEDYDIVNYQYFDASIVKEDKIHKYFFLHVISNFDIIDYSETLINLKDYKQVVKKQVKFNNEKEYEEQTKNYLIDHDLDTGIAQLKLLKNIDLGRFLDDMSLYVSEKLKTDIEKAGFTGFAFKPASFEVLA